MNRANLVRLGVLLAFVSVSLAADLKVGFAEFERESIGGSPVASSLFSITNPEGILVSEAGVEAGVPLSRGRIFVQQDRDVGTGIALANPSGISLKLNLALRDREGHLIDGIDNFSLGPHQHVARFVSELFENVPGGFTGSLSFEVTGSGNKVAAVTLRQSVNPFGEPLLTTLPVVDLALDTDSSSEFIFPHLGAGPGFSTQLILINPSSVRTEGSIQLFSSEGNKLELQSGDTVASSFPFVLAPHGTFFTDFVTPSAGALGVGYARIQVTAGNLPSGSAIFRFTDGADPVSEAGVGASPRMTKARFFVDTRDTSTGFAVVNPNSVPLNLKLRLHDANGRLQSESSHQLAAGAHLAKFVGEVFQLAPRFVGLLEIESNGSFVPITLKLSQNSRRHSVLTTLPVANVEDPLLDTLIVLPQVATGPSPIGEFLTRLIFIAPVQEENASGILRFWQGLGEPLRLVYTDGEMPYSVEGSSLGEFLFTERPGEAVLDRRESVSAEVGSEGGSLVLEDCMGNQVNLSVPPYALLTSREITMTCLGSRPVDTLGTNIFPGILLEPSGLVFRYPAELEIHLPLPIEDPGRNSLFTMGVEGVPQPVTNDGAGNVLVGEVRHFSEYWADSANLADLLKQIEWIVWAKQDPQMRDKFLEKFRSEMGYELDLDKLDMQTLEFMLNFAELNIYAEFRRWGDDLNASVDQDLFRDFLEQLVIQFLTTPQPKEACGYFHSFALELQKVSDLILDVNPDLDNRVRELNKLCVSTDLTGWWRSQRRRQSETCHRIVQPIRVCEPSCGPVGYDRFVESDITNSYRFYIEQAGSNFKISFPQEPDAPFYIGSIEATGDLLYPFHLRLSIPSDASLECRTFFETKGGFEFGDPICEEDPGLPNQCEPVSCRDSEKLFAKVTSSGQIEGSSRWLIRASVKEWLEGCCDYFTSIACRGSGPFVATRD
ncbi:MAG: hypothetical protein JSU96_13465 [Acidobacteriota bacterium]|nr:MAG: hypothetical protein JSU96_13465 [Acidobacteriota bacterium]